MSQMFDPSLNRIMLEAQVNQALARGEISQGQAAELLSGGAAAAAAVSSSTPGAFAGGVDVTQTARTGKTLIVWVIVGVVLYAVLKKR